jgi:preprotein translocase subunit SecA
MEGLAGPEIESLVMERLEKRYAEKEELVGGEVMRETERMIMLSIVDQQWKDHLLSMDHLKEGIGMRAYGQKDPLVEYKKEAYVIFQEMMERIEDETTRFLFFLQPVLGERPHVPFADEDWPEAGGGGEPVAVPDQPQSKAAQESFIDLTRNIHRKKEREMEMLQFAGSQAGPSTQSTVVKGDKVGRNDPCPCGSGKKYKKCHGA